MDKTAKMSYMRLQYWAIYSLWIITTLNKHVLKYFNYLTENVISHVKRFMRTCHFQICCYPSPLFFTHCNSDMEKKPAFPVLWGIWLSRNSTFKNRDCNQNKGIAAPSTMKYILSLPTYLNALISSFHIYSNTKQDEISLEKG